MNTNHEKEINNKSVSEPENTNMLLAAFMLFIFPIISAFLGVYLGRYIGKSIGVSSKISQAIGGMLAFALAVLVIKLFDKSAKVDETAEKIYWEDL